MENAPTQKTKNATNLMINPKMVSESTTTIAAKESSPLTTVDPKADPNMASTENTPTSDSSVTSKTRADESSLASASKGSAVVADSGDGTQLTQLDTNPAFNSMPSQPTLTSSPPTMTKTASNSISVYPKRVNTTVDLKDTLFPKEKVNSSTAIVNAAAVKTLPKNVNRAKSPQINDAVSPRNASTTATAPNTSKASPALNNKENVNPNHNGPKHSGKGAAFQTKKSPGTDTAKSVPGGSDISELRAKCQYLSLDASGSLADLNRRLAKHYAREEEFQLQVEEQERVFAKEKEEKVQLEKDDTARRASRASSHASGSNTPNLKSPIVPSPSTFSNTPRPHGTSSSQMHSPLTPSAQPFFPQDIRLQQTGTQEQITAEATGPLASRDIKSEVNFSHWKSENARPSRFASQDVRLDLNYMLPKKGATTTVGQSDSQGNGYHQVTKPVVNPARTTFRTFGSQDIRRYQENKPTGRADMPKVPGVHQAVKPTSTSNVKVFKTDRALDKTDYLHTHTHEIKSECKMRRLPSWGDRKTVVTRLLDQHLGRLRAEFVHARDEVAKNTEAGPEALLRKDILWYRLECFTEHRQNQIGLAGEPHRAASYVADRERKHASPRFAKIMGGELAQLIAREKQLEDDKTKTKVSPDAASKEMDGGVKLETVIR
ncbi:hypothetical protein VTL71DRAFT_5092 [Oculimacula yallundae]|uniref:Uncharacterized protein n=1 Tax=Oculimacula yallundae TaxID=86028 RepID=A0ABR4C129_9HELO